MHGRVRGGGVDALLKGEDDGLGQAHGVGDGAVLGTVGIGALVSADAVAVGLGEGRLDDGDVLVGHEHLEVVERLATDAVGDGGLDASLLDSHVHDLGHVGGQREVGVAADDDQRNRGDERQDVVLEELDDSHSASLLSV